MHALMRASALLITINTIAVGTAAVRADEDPAAAAAVTAAEVGRPAPDFVVTGIDDKPFRLSEKLRSGDRNIVLLFSRAHW